jgi:glmM: phosphoglucosamine mutase
LRWQARAACSCARAEPSRLSACWPRRPTKHPPMPPWSASPTRSRLC